MKCYERNDSGGSESTDEQEKPTTSPSSDKENKKRQALITDVFKSGKLYFCNIRSAPAAKKH